MWSSACRFFASFVLDPSALPEAPVGAEIFLQVGVERRVHPDVIEAGSQIVH